MYSTFTVTSIHDCFFFLYSVHIDLSPWSTAIRFGVHDPTKGIFTTGDTIYKYNSCMSFILSFIIVIVNIGAYCSSGIRFHFVSHAFLHPFRWKGLQPYSITSPSWVLQHIPTWICCRNGVRSSRERNGTDSPLLHQQPAATSILQ